MDIPIHYRVGKHDSTSVYTGPYERGGPLLRVRLECPIEKKFPRKFSKKLKAAGGSYASCRGNWHYTRQVSVKWGDDVSAEKLVNDILAFFDEVSPGEDIEVHFVTDNGSFTVHTTHVGRTFLALFMHACEKVNRWCTNKNTQEFSTKEDAEVFIAEKADEQAEAKRASAERKEVLNQLIQAFEEAGFPCSSFDIRFDVKTSRRLIEFLEEHRK